MFFYCNFTNRTPEKPFKAYKVKDVYYPSDNSEGKVFIYGEGWKKGKSPIEIPLITELTLENVKTHYEKYGKFCTFYAITGFELGSQDCVVSAANREFNVATSFDCSFEYVANCVGQIKSTNQKIFKIMMDKYGIDMESKYNYQYTKDDPEHKHLIVRNDLFMIKPSYSLMYYILTKPNLDVINDDSLLWRHYVTMFGVKNKDEFPVCMKDRLTFLFNKEISDDYERILNDFPL